MIPCPHGWCGCFDTLDGKPPGTVAACRRLRADAEKWRLFKRFSPVEQKRALDAILIANAAVRAAARKKK